MCDRTRERNDEKKGKSTPHFIVGNHNDGRRRQRMRGREQRGEKCGKKQ